MKTVKPIIWLCAVALLPLIGLLFRGCSGLGRNSLAQWGFPLSDTKVLIDRAPWNLTGEQRFLKAKMTLSEANTLHKAFLQQSGRGVNSATKVFRSLLPNPQWTPDSTKQIWAGDFRRGDKKYPYLCEYMFEAEGPDSIVLYFYAVTFDN